jgi:hypothetical protein
VRFDERHDRCPDLVPSVTELGTNRRFCTRHEFGIGARIGDKAATLA